MTMQIHILDLKCHNLLGELHIAHQKKISGGSSAVDFSIKSAGNHFNFDLNFNELAKSSINPKIYSFAAKLERKVLSVGNIRAQVNNSTSKVTINRQEF